MNEDLVQALKATDRAKVKELRVVTVQAFG